MQTIGEAIYEAAFKSENELHPKENSKNEIKLPTCIADLIREDHFYQHHELVVEDMKAIYNTAIRDCIQRIKNEYSFLPQPSEHIKYIIKVIGENMIDM